MTTVSTHLSLYADARFVLRGRVSSQEHFRTTFNFTRISFTPALKPTTQTFWLCISTELRFAVLIESNLERRTETVERKWASV